MSTRRVEVLLAAHGEAETSGLRENFSVGWHTLSHVAEVMPMPAPLRGVICTLAAVRRRLGGGDGSPHNAHTRAQAEALARRLDADAALDCEVRAVFGSATPGLEAQLDEAPAEGCERVVISMTPIDSRLSCGRACHHLAAGDPAAATRVIARLWDDPRFVAVNVAHLFSQLELPARAQRCALVLVLHGTLVRDARGCTPGFHTGLEETQAFAARLREAVATDARSPFARIEVGFLNHDVGGEWTRPTLSEVLSALAADGVDAVAAFPCEYLVDGSDTVGKTAAALAAGPIPLAQRVDCLNDAPAFIDYLALRVREVLAGDGAVAPARAHCEACPRGL